MQLDKSSTMSTTTKELQQAVIKKHGLKVTVKRKSTAIKRTRTAGTGVCALPVPRSLERIMTNEMHEQQPGVKEDETENHELEIPCDTLLAMQSIIRAQHCLFIPSSRTERAMIPSILESQIYQKLQNPTDGDSIATKEILHLIHTNQLRRLTSVDNTVVTYMHTRDYVRAVWDAAHHQASEAPLQKTKIDCIVTWFLASLPKWTSPTISKDDMLHWAYTHTTLSDAIEILLTKLRLLIPTTTKDTYMFWLPHWGSVLKALDKAQTNIRLRIKRSMHKELSEQSVRTLSLPSGMSAYFVTQTLIANGTVQCCERPAGRFFRLTDNHLHQK